MVGRLAGPLNWIDALRGRLAALPASVGSHLVAGRGRLPRRRIPYLNRDLPNGAGVVASAALIFASAAYGAIRGDHLDAVAAAFIDIRDAAASAAGFRITSVAVTGQRQVTREEILAIAGVTGRSSLLFLDVDSARERLKANPWIADASVLKFYPDRLQINVTERQAFALWQKDGRLAVIARDGTVLEPYVAPRFTRLPFVVGRGAHTQAEAFVALLDRHPHIQNQVRAAVLVAERRWNLRLKNGMDVRLPEADPDKALERLTALDRDRNLLSRDITVVDLRLPDRVTVRLSEGAAQARSEALKDKKKKKGDA